LRGRGDVIYFRDGVQGSAGTMPKEMGDGAAFDLSLAGPFTGYQGGGLVGDDPSAYLIYDYQLGNDWDLNTNWTVMWFEYNLGDSTWHRTALRSDGKFVFDGVQDDDRWELGNGLNMEWEFSVFDGQLRMEAVGGDGGVLHHVVVLPCIASDTVITAFMNMTVPWGPLPMLYVTGDAITTSHEYMFGSNVRESWVRADFGDGLGLISNNLTIDFDISFVPSGWYQDATVPTQGTTTCAPEVPTAELTGAWLEPMVLETTDLTIGNISDKGPGAPTSPITITGAPTTEWSCLVNRSPSGDVVWAHKFIPVGGNVRAFISNTATKAGQTYGLVCGWCESVTLDISQSDGTLITTLSRPAEYTSSAVNTAWGWAASFDLTTGALNWAQVGTFDDTCTSNLTRLRAQHLVFGGSTGEDLMMVVDARTVENASSDVPNPQWGTGTVAVMENINSANVGAGFVSTQWIVQIDPTTGDPVSTTSHVANFNDDAPVFGTVNRGSVGETFINRSNLLWNPTTSLWYLSANYSAHGGLGVVGTYIGKGKTGEFQTRNTDEFGGSGSVKAYICTYDATLEPQNAVTLACDVVTNGNNDYAYNHEVHLVPDGSGDVFWGWQNMAGSPAVNLQRNGVLGNYGGGQYSVTDAKTNNSVTVRLDTNLEVVWESTAFSSAYIALGRGHSINMLPVPNDSTKMLAAVTTWNVNADANEPTSLYGSANVSFDRKQTFVAAFDIATGAFVDEREMERAQSDDKMQILSMQTATSGPDNGITFALVVMSTDTNTTVQGFYDTAGVRQYTTSDYWNANGAVYTASVGGAVHLVAFDADGELLPGRCCPLSAIQDGNNLFNYWAGDISLY
jgi:hypothetical protein